MTRKIFFLLPVYNESKSIYDLCLSIDSLITYCGFACEVLVVNDASSDDSADWLDKAQKKVKACPIKVIAHDTNQGLQGALNTGLLALGRVIAPQDVLVTMDGDNTHNPFLVPEMVNRLNQGADIVIASRYCEQSRIKGVVWWRQFLSLGARFSYKVFWNIPGVKDYTCLFRAHRGESILRFLESLKSAEPPLKQQSFACTTELLKYLSRQGLIITEAPLLLDYTKKTGASNARIFKTIMTSLKIMVGQR